MRYPIAALLADLRAIDEHPAVEAKRSLSEDVYPTIARFQRARSGWRCLVAGIARVDGRYGRGRGRSGPGLERRLSACAGDKFNRRFRPAVWSEVVEGKVVVGVPSQRRARGQAHLPVEGRSTRGGAGIGSAVRCSDDDIPSSTSARRPYETRSSPTPRWRISISTSWPATAPLARREPQHGLRDLRPLISCRRSAARG